MDFLLIYPLLFIYLVVPPVLIYRSPSSVGWKKTVWVSGCFLSAFVPVVLFSVGLVLAVKFGSYEQRTAKSMPIVVAMLNIAMLVLPWIIYFIFKAKHVKSPP